MSVSCQQETHAPQQTAILFNHLVGVVNLRGGCCDGGHFVLLRLLSTESSRVGATRLSSALPTGLAQTLNHVGVILRPHPRR